MGHSFLWGIFSVLLSLGGIAAGQTNIAHILPNTLPGRDSSLPSVAVNVNLVLVPVSVTDILHRPVMGLKRDNFEVYEEDVAQKIRHFYQEDSPISVALVLDTSGSMAKRMDLLRDAVDQFFVNANPLDDYTLITVSDRPEVLLRGCRSIEDIRSAMANLKPAGWTALLDSIRLGTMALKAARNERKVVLIVSDGMDNVSRHKLRDVAAIVEESDSDAYAIGVMDEALPFFGKFTERINRKLLTRITDTTGGRTVVVNRMDDLPGTAAQLSLEMRSQYVLGYRPPDGAHERKWRRVKVNVTANEEVRANYRKLYFTPGD